MNAYGYTATRRHQPAASFLLFNRQGIIHTTEYAKWCHILPAKYRIYFKSCTTVFQIIHGLSPDYLVDTVNFASYTRPNLRSSDDSLRLNIPDCNKCIEYGIIYEG